MQQIKNLIFDLGEVIIDIDFKRVLAEFQKLGAVDFSEVISYNAQHHIFDLLETGKISPQEFRDEIKQFLKPGVTDREIDHAWNSIMIDFPEDKFQLLLELKPRYKTFALSNTNAIHVTTFDAQVKDRFGAPSLESFFHKAYYSNEIGLRKPDKEIYQYILKQENLIPAETFFVDDKSENVAAALEMDMEAYELKDRDKLAHLLKELKII